MEETDNSVTEPTKVVNITQVKSDRTQLSDSELSDMEQEQCHIESMRRTMDAETVNVEENELKCMSVKDIVKSIVGKDIMDLPSQSTFQSEKLLMLSPRKFKQPTQTLQCRTKVDLVLPDTKPCFYDPKQPLVSPVFDIKKLPQVFKDIPWVGVVQSEEELKSAQQEKLKVFVGGDLTEQQFGRLEEYCDINNLITGRELRAESQDFTEAVDNLKDYSEPNVEPPLHSYARYKQRIEQDTQNHFCSKLKYRSMRITTLKNEFEETSPEDQLIPGKDLLFRLRIYRQFAYNPRSTIPYLRILRCTRNPVLAYDLMVLGRQKLSVLRQHITCHNDLGLRLDVSNDPKADPPMVCKDLFPSGFLFINNVFYIATGPRCSDLSAPIREWAEKRGYSNFEVKDMDSCTFGELQIKLGNPELYLHQGECEHLFTFSDVRLITTSDPLTAKHYPAHSIVSRSRALYCTSCAEYFGKWIVSGCNITPFDPAFFCDTCFDLYLYTEKGEKIADFKAYPFTYNSNLTY